MKCTLCTSSIQCHFGWVCPVSHAITAYSRCYYMLSDFMYTVWKSKCTFCKLCTCTCCHILYILTECSPCVHSRYVTLLCIPLCILTCYVLLCYVLYARCYVVCMCHYRVTTLCVCILLTCMLGYMDLTHKVYMYILLSHFIALESGYWES